MSCHCTSDHQSIPPTHQDFRWIHGPGQQDRRAGFVERTRDIAAGVHACLQIIYSSDLVREINLDDGLGEISALAIGRADAVALFRLSVAASGLLCEAADEQITLLNALA